MTELPLVIINVQRGGPSTGLPTKTEQADLFQAVWGRNGECPAIVLAPATPGDCFHMAIEAVRLAFKYMSPVFYLSDGYLANGAEPWAIPDIDSLPKIEVTFASDPATFMPYARDEQTLARPYAIPGTPGLEHRIGGIEKQHITGNVNYDPENHHLMVKLRQEKIDRVVNDIPLLEVMESQGVQAEGEISARAPNSTASDMTLKALGKQIGTIVSYFDGAAGGELVSFGPEETYTGRRLEDIRLGADFYDVLNWKKNFKTIEVKRMGKVGDEDVYVVEKRGERGTPVIDYVSAKTFLTVKRDSVVVSDTTGVELPVTQSFSDYRMVDGVMVPFKMTSNNIANGDIVLRVADLKWDVALPDSLFKKPVVGK